MTNRPQNIGAPAPGIIELAEGLIHRLFYEWTPAVNDAVMAVHVADWPDPLLQSIAQNAQDAIDSGANELEITHIAKTTEQAGSLARISEVKPVWDLDYAVQELQKDAQRRRFEVDRANTAQAMQHASPDDVKALMSRLIVDPPKKNKGDGLHELVKDTISGKRKNIHTPWQKLNSLTHSLLPGSILLVCGGPGSGKTFYLIQLLNWFFNQQVPFSYYALEEDKPFVLLRLLAQMARNAEMLNPDWMTLNGEEAERHLKTFEGRLKDLGKVIFAAPEKKVSLTEIPQWIQHRATKGDRVIIVDPASVTDFGKDIAKNVNEFMERTKDILRKHQCSAIIALHPNTESMATGAINMGMLKGGANFSILAQSIVWLEIPPFDTIENVESQYGEHPLHVNRRLHLLKTRNGKGQGMKLAYMFNPDTLQFEELGIIKKLGKDKKQVRQPAQIPYNEQDDPYADDDSTF